MDAVFLIGRVLFVVLFVMSGSNFHLRQRHTGAEFARQAGAPAPELLVPLSGVAAIAGGLMVALGIWGDVGALLLAGFLVGITPFMHAYWKVTDPVQQATQLSHFWKNVAMLGGTLILFWVFNQTQGEAPLTITDPLFDRID